MLTLNLETEDFILRDIKKDELDLALKLYNESEVSMFATGIDRRLSINDMREKYLEVLINRHEFFTGIFMKEGNEMIGIIKGRLDYENNENFWISSFLIGRNHRYEGIGKKCINAFIAFISKTYDIKRIFTGVISGNTGGILFWENMGFSYYRTIEQFIKLNSMFEDYIIMKKVIEKT